MRSPLRPLLALVGFIGLVISFAVIFGYDLSTRYNHPGMTETQLLLAFWPGYLVRIVLLIVAWIVYSKGQR
jgi:hypothetical protein